MNNETNYRNKLLHLYDPKKEGLGSYDLNYINAYRKVKNNTNNINKNDEERYAAWFHILEVFRN